MKSKLFSVHDFAQNDDFIKDLTKLVRLPEEAIKRLAAHVSEAMLTETGVEESTVLKQASEDLGVPRSDLDQAVGVSKYLITKFLPSGDVEGDDPADLVADIKESIEVPAEKEQCLIDYLAELAQWSRETWHEVSRRRRSARTAIPVVRGVSSGVDFRAVFDTQFKTGDDLDSYAPKCLGTIAVGIVEIRVTGGPREESLCFQVDERSLRLLIEHLIALQKEMQVAQDCLNLKEATERDG